MFTDSRKQLHFRVRRGQASGILRHSRLPLNSLPGAHLHRHHPHATTEVSVLGFGGAELGFNAGVTDETVAALLLPRSTP